MALNFALQELNLYYNNINKLRVEEWKEKKGTPMKVHFIVFYFYCNYTVTFSALRCGIAEKRLTLICISLDNKRITKQHLTFVICLVLLNSELIFRNPAPHSFSGPVEF